MSLLNYQARGLLSPAAQEIVCDPHWSQKIARALRESRNGQVKSLREFRISMTETDAGQTPIKDSPG